MSGNDLQKLEAAQEAATPSEQGGKRMIGGEASLAQIRVIDFAVVELGVTRSRFLVDSAVERAEAILAERGIVIPSSPSAA